jgi:hypothetical protein
MTGPQLGRLARGNALHREDLMNGDLMSEILLLISGSLMFIMLSLILVAVLTQTAALP